MAKVTERSLKDTCAIANAGVLRTWTFGLKVERYGAGFMLWQLFRDSSRGQLPLVNKPLPAKEAFRFIQGFIAAAATANGVENGVDF